MHKKTNQFKKGKKPSLVFLVKERLNSKKRYGHSKHLDKENPDIDTKDYIYSTKTFKNYLQWCVDFAKYCKIQNPKIKTLIDCEQYIGNYIDYMIKEKGYSPSTINSKLSALTKITPYSVDEMKDMTTTVAPKRTRASITNNRGPKPDSNTFSEKNHQELVNFIKATGLRKSGLNRVRISDIDIKAQTITIKEKGGKVRTSEILDMNAVLVVIEKAQANSQDKLFGGKSFKNPKECPSHRYRQDYAQTLYKKYARSLSTLLHYEKYTCRKDKAGIVYDRKAMMIVSNNLGHNRIDVIATSYL